MPSKRTSILVGLFMICALTLIADEFVFGRTLLDSFMTGLFSLVSIIIIPLLPIMVVSIILDRRDAGDTSPPTRTRDTEGRTGGIRSISGQPVPQRTQTRIRRGRRAKRLETIVVEGEEKPAAQARPVQTQPVREHPKPQPVSSPAAQAAPEKPAIDVEQQLTAIEQEMSKLEEEMGEPGAEFPSAPLPTESAGTDQTETTSDIDSLFPSLDLPQEDKSSEIKALDELLARLEQRRRTGSISESTYERLRTRYLKRKAEISSG